MEPHDSDSPPVWTRPAKLRMRAFRAIPLLGGVAVIGVSLVAGMLLADESAAPAIVAIPVPVQLPAPAVQPAPITVTVAAPTPPVVDPPVFVDYRATTPLIDTDCIVGDDGGLTTSPAVEKPTCAWDSGFPAISVDGSQIVEAHVPADDGRGNPGLIVVFTDVATSRQVRSITVLDPDEIEFGKPPDAQLRAKLRKRAAAAQRLIDARKFRSLIDLGSHNAGNEAGMPGDPTTIHAEYSGDTMRLLDPATKTALWRHTFSAPSPWAKPDPDKECQAWYLAEVQSWWDPEKRVVLGRLFYHHGGCMCGSTSIPQVFRL